MVWELRQQSKLPEARIDIRHQRRVGKPRSPGFGENPESKIREIAQKKMSDLNAADLEGAIKIIQGTARSMGIGTTLTTVYRVYQQEVRDILGIPERYEIIALVPMGRPRGQFGVAPRRPVESVTHGNRFGEKR